MDSNQLHIDINSALNQPDTFMLGIHLLTKIKVQYIQDKINLVIIISECQNKPVLDVAYWE